jgi:hypothetical protein
MTTDPERKGLRFEVSKTPNGNWEWEFIGAEGALARSPIHFLDEKAARSHIHANKGRMGNARRAKVVTVNDLD